MSSRLAALHQYLLSCEQPVTVLLPTQSSADALLTSFAQRGLGITLATFTTVRAFAEGHSQIELLRRQWKRIAPEAGPIVIGRLMHDLSGILPAQRADDWDAHVWDSLQTVRDWLGSTDPTDADAPREAPDPTWPVAWKDLRALEGRFRAFLEANNLYDDRRLYDLAQYIFSEASDVPKGTLVLPDELTLTNAATRLLHTLASGGTRLVRWSLLPALTAEQTSTLPAISNIAAGRFAALPSIQARPSGVHRAPLERHVATGIEHSFQVALGSMVQHGTPLDQCVWVLASPSDHRSQVVSLLDRTALPYTIEGGKPIHHAASGRFFLGICTWHQMGYDKDGLAEFLSSGSLRDPLMGVRLAQMRAISPRVSLFDETSAGSSTAPSTSQDVDEQDGAADDRPVPTHVPTDSPSRVIQSLFRALNALLPLSGTVETGAVLRGLITIHDEWVSTHEGDASARQSVLERLRSLEAVFPPEMSVRLFVQHLQSALHNHQFDAAGPKPGHLFVTTLEQSMYAIRPHVWVFGLDQQRFPGGMAQNILLPDLLRTRLEGMESADSYAFRRSALLNHLAADVGEALHWFTHSHEAGVDEASYPAFLFSHPPLPGHGEALAGSDARDVADADRLAPPKRYALPVLEPTAATPLATVRLDQASSAEPSLFGLGQAHDETPHLSVTAWERLLSCPRQFYFQDVARIEVPDEEDPILLAGVDARIRGQAIHHLLFELMRPYAMEAPEPAEAHPGGEEGRFSIPWMVDIPSGRSGRVPATTELRTRLAAISEHIVTYVSDFFLGIDEPTLTRLRGELLAHGETFIASQAEYEGRVRCLEKNVRAPLSLSASREVLIRGRLDRIDILPDGRHALWDYKTGRSVDRFGKATFLALDHLQGALYSLAVETALGYEVAEAGYWFTHPEASPARLSEPRADGSLLGRCLDVLIALHQSGDFVPTRHIRNTNERPCRYCRYVALCGDLEKLEDRVAEAKESPDTPEAALAYLQLDLRSA